MQGSKYHVEQLRKGKECIIVMSVLLLCCVVVATSCVAIGMIRLHDVSLMYIYVESAYGVVGGATGQRTWHT
jgi:hypothetical protein